LDLLESSLPELFFNVFHICNTRKVLLQQVFGMYTGHKHIFIMRAVVNGYLSPLWKCCHMTPEKIMIELNGARRFEAVDLNTLRIESRHDMFYCAILSC